MKMVSKLHVLVMIVDSVEDVNYENIKKHIALFEGEK